MIHHYNSQVKNIVLQVTLHQMHKEISPITKLYIARCSIIVYAHEEKGMTITTLTEEEKKKAKTLKGQIMLR